VLLRGYLAPYYMPLLWTCTYMELPPEWPYPYPLFPPWPHPYPPPPPFPHLFFFFFLFFVPPKFVECALRTIF